MEHSDTPPLWVQPVVWTVIVVCAVVLVVALLTRTWWTVFSTGLLLFSQAITVWRVRTGDGQPEGGNGQAMSIASRLCPEVRTRRSPTGRHEHGGPLFGASRANVATAEGAARIGCVPSR